MNLTKTVKKYRDLFASAPKVETAHDEKGHFYVSPATGEKYHSVTYYTSFIKDPSLSEWKKNRAMEAITEKWRPNQGYSQELIDAIIVEAKAKPQMEFEGAGSIGSATHAWRQEWFKSWIEYNDIEYTDSVIDEWPLPKGADPEVISGCRAIKRFLKETGAIPVACEMALVDDELKVGGTIDDLMVFPNAEKVAIMPKTYNERMGWSVGAYEIKHHPSLVFVDLKTSNQGKKPAYAYQVRGFYQRMISKTFHVRPKKTYILHTSKLNGDYSLIDLTEMKFLEKDCKDLVRLSRSWDNVTQSFKPKVITI